MSQATTPSTSAATNAEIIASPVAGDFRLDARHPATEWQRARPIIFCSDWQGNNPDEQRETGVRVLWSWQTLYLRFECRYRELYLFEDSDATAAGTTFGTAMWRKPFFSPILAGALLPGV